MNFPIRIDYKNCPVEIDNHRFLQAVVFFCNDVLSQYIGKFEQINIYFDDSIQDDWSGVFFCKENSIYINLNSNNIRNSRCFRNFRKRLFYILLHEIGHADDLLNKYNCIGTLEDFHKATKGPELDKYDNISHKLKLLQINLP